MPTYEYACPTCGIVEAFQSIKEAALTICPTCGHDGITRMISRGGGIIFKGSGFWETDYNRSGDYASKSKSEAPVTATPAPQSQAEAKPATPAPSTPPASPKPSSGDAASQ